MNAQACLSLHHLPLHLVPFSCELAQLIRKFGMKTRKYSVHWNSLFCRASSDILTFCHFILKKTKTNWTASSEFGTYRLCEQRRFRRACASAQSRQNLRCSLIQALNQEEPSDRKPDPWPLWMAGHAQLRLVMPECSKTQIRLKRPNWWKKVWRRLVQHENLQLMEKKKKKEVTSCLGWNPEVLLVQFCKCLASAKSSVVCEHNQKENKKKIQKKRKKNTSEFPITSYS